MHHYHHLHPQCIVATATQATELESQLSFLQTGVAELQAVLYAPAQGVPPRQLRVATSFDSSGRARLRGVAGDVRAAAADGVADPGLGPTRLQRCYSENSCANRHGP